MGRRLVAVALLVVGVSLTTVEPASADNCKELVKSVLDLADKAKVEDCLRTGGNWGRVIGTVVGGAGVVIAGLGLVSPNRPPRNVAPPEDRSHQQLSKDPCARLAARARRIGQLDEARKKLESEIMTEFHKLAQDASIYTGMYRNLQAAWYKARQCLFAARSLNGATYGLAIVGIAGVIKGAIAYAMLAPTGASAAMTEAEFALAKAAAFKDVATGAIGYLTGLAKDFVGELTPSNVPGAKPWHDPWAEEIRQALIAQLQPVATSYAAAATSYNQRMAQWGANRQQDLDLILQQIRTEAAAWNADAAQCHDADQLPPEPPGSQAPPMVLQLPQVPTDFDEPWLAGGTWDVFQ